MLLDALMRSYLYMTARVMPFNVVFLEGLFISFINALYSFTFLANLSLGTPSALANLAIHLLMIALSTPFAKCLGTWLRFPATTIIKNLP